MRILFLSHYFYPEGNAPATRVYQLCRRWARAGHQVTVLTGVPSVPAGVVYEGYRNRWRSQIEDVEGVRVVRVWTYIAANQGFVRRIANYLSFLLSAALRSLWLERPDVVAATSPQFFCGWAGVAVSRLKRRPFVLEIRDLWPESIVAVGALRQGLLVRLLEWLERRLYGAARHIVAVGEGYRQGLLERGVPPEKVSVIPNGVDLGEFEPREADADLARQYGLTGRFVCSYVGTVGLACGLDVVLRAARRLQAVGDERFLFLLVGDGAMRRELEERAAADGLDNVVFTGRQPKESMPRFLSVTDACLVHLRRTELFRTVLPSKIFEALAMETPVLLGVEGEAAELVRAAGGGLCFTPESEDELLGALERLAAEPDLAARLGRTGRAFVVEHYDRDKQALDYLRRLQRQVPAAP